jgi:hypothetical protein
VASLARGGFVPVTGAAGRALTTVCHKGQFTFVLAGVFILLFEFEFAVGWNMGTSFG